MKTDLVSEYYKRHHSGETGFRRYDFTFGGDERIQWFRSRFPSGRGRVLDIGCRDGTFTHSVAAGNDVVGVDVDDNAIEVARTRHGIDARRVNLNVEPMPFEDDSFDVVMAGEVLEHLQFPSEIVSGIHRVLKRGGLFLGSVPNAFRLPNRLKFLMGKDFETDPTHLHHFAPSSLRELLSAFAVVDLDFILGRKRWLHPRLLGSVMVWAARK